MSSPVDRLRIALRDLVALSTIPAAWVGREPAAIAVGLADVLVGTLPLNFVFVRLRDCNGGGTVDATRGNAWKEFPEWLERRLATGGPFSRKEIVPDVRDGAQPSCGLVIPIGTTRTAGSWPSPVIAPTFPPRRTNCFFPWRPTRLRPRFRAHVSSTSAAALRKICGELAMSSR